MKAIRTGGSRVARATTPGSAGSQSARDEGFTLIELMVVLLILGILLAVAIPTFLGTTKGADDRQAQSNLTNALIAAKAIYVQENGYPVSATMATTLKSQEPELTYATTKSLGPNSVSEATNATATTLGTRLVLANYSTQSQVCWVVMDLQSKTSATPTHPVTAGDWYGYAILTTNTTCKATKWNGKTHPAGGAWVQNSYPSLTTGH